MLLKIPASLHFIHNLLIIFLHAAVFQEMACDLMAGLPQIKNITFASNVELFFK